MLLVAPSLAAMPLQPRQCDEYCGSDNQYCCSAGLTCYTSLGITGCSARGVATSTSIPVNGGPINSGPVNDGNSAYSPSTSTSTTGIDSHALPPSATASSTSASPTTSVPQTGPERSKSPARIAGPVVGGVVGVLLMVFVVWVMYKKRSQRAAAVSVEQERFEKAELEASDIARETAYELPSNDMPSHELPANEAKSELP